MINIYLKIAILIIIFLLPVTLLSISGITDVVGNFNNFVIPFIPVELLFLFPIVGLGIAFKIYQSIK